MKPSKVKTDRKQARVKHEFKMWYSDDIRRHIRWLKRRNFKGKSISEEGVILWTILIAVYHKEFISNALFKWANYKIDEGFENVDAIKLISRQLADKPCKTKVKS